MEKGPFRVSLSSRQCFGPSPQTQVITRKLECFGWLSVKNFYQVRGGLDKAMPQEIACFLSWM